MTKQSTAELLADYYVDVVLEGQAIDEEIVHNAFLAGYAKASEAAKDDIAQMAAMCNEIVKLRAENERLKELLK